MLLTPSVVFLARMMELSSVNNVLTFWLTAETTIDALIAGTPLVRWSIDHRPIELTDSLSLTVILLYTLHSSRTGMRNSDKVLNRLMRASVQTGELNHVLYLLKHVLSI